MNPQAQRERTLRLELQHWRQTAQTATSQKAQAEADRDRWKRSAEEAWQFAKTIAKTSRTVQT